MSGNNNIKSLTKISSVVTERDKKIWENQAFLICIKKETEKLKNNLEEIKKRKEHFEKENKILEARLNDFKWSNTVQQQTLRTNLESNMSNEELINSGSYFQYEMRKKYAETLAAYQQEYEDRRQTCMNNSHTYQDLHKLEVREKILQVKEKNLRVKIENLCRSIKQRDDFRKKIAQNTIIKFAEYYIIYHKNIKLIEEIQELKKRESCLIKEHLQQSNLAKEKQRVSLKREQHNTSEKVIEKPITKPAVEEESFDGNIQTFLNEDLFPCIMTMSQMEVETTAEPTKQSPKIKILEMSTIKPTIAKPRLDLRKQAERIALQVTKRRSFGKDSQNSQSSQASNNTTSPKQSQENAVALRVDQQKEVQLSQNKNQSQIYMHSQKRQHISQPLLSQSQSKKIKPNYSLSQQNEEQSIGIEKTTSSILKSQKNVDEDHISSNFFNSKKKSVTFQSGDRYTAADESFPPLFENKMQMKTNVQNATSTNNFLMFGINEAESGNIPDMNIFHKPFAYSKTQRSKKPDQNTAETSANQEVHERGISDALTAATVSFPSGSTAFMTSNVMSPNSSQSIINDQDLLMDNNFNTSANTYFAEPEEGEEDNFMFGASKGNNFFAFN